MSPTFKVSDFPIVLSLTPSLPLITMSSTVVRYLGLRVKVTTAVRDRVSTATAVSTSASAYPLSKRVDWRNTRDESSLIRLRGPFSPSTTRRLSSLCESSVGVGWLTMMSATSVGGPSLMEKVTPT